MPADTSRYRINSLKPFESSLEINWQDDHVSNRTRTTEIETRSLGQRNATGHLLHELPGSSRLPRITPEVSRNHSWAWFFILREVLPESEHTESIAALVGKLRMTNYEIYELKSKPNPEISADTAVPLRLHTDEPYRIDPPGITFFHVLTQSKNGGASTLADSFKIAESLRQNNPEAFDILRSVSAKFHRSLAEGRKFEYQHPVIQCDSDGDISSVRLLDRGMAPVDCALDRVEPFYDALRQLLELIYHGEGTIKIRLESGEMLVFNNQRLMHGRTSFDPADGRHVPAVR
jgi:alpha-ketoglutarate-dependent taurine dioxygenase